MVRTKKSNLSLSDSQKEANGGSKGISAREWQHANSVLGDLKSLLGNKIEEHWGSSNFFRKYRVSVKAALDQSLRLMKQVQSELDDLRDSLPAREKRKLMRLLWPRVPEEERFVDPSVSREGRYLFEKRKRLEAATGRRLQDLFKGLARGVVPFFIGVYGAVAEDADGYEPCAGSKAGWSIVPGRVLLGLGTEEHMLKANDLRLAIDQIRSTQLEALYGDAYDGVRLDEMTSAALEGVWEMSAVQGEIDSIVLDTVKTLTDALEAVYRDTQKFRKSVRDQLKLDGQRRQSLKEAIVSLRDATSDQIRAIWARNAEEFAVLENAYSANDDAMFEATELGRKLNDLMIRNGASVAYVPEPVVLQGHAEVWYQDAAALKRAICEAEMKIQPALATAFGVSSFREHVKIRDCGYTPIASLISTMTLVGNGQEHHFEMGSYMFVDGVSTLIDDLEKGDTMCMSDGCYPITEKMYNSPPSPETKRLLDVAMISLYSGSPMPLNASGRLGPSKWEPMFPNGEPHALWEGGFLAHSVGKLVKEEGGSEQQMPDIDAMYRKTVRLIPMASPGGGAIERWRVHRIPRPEMQLVSLTPLGELLVDGDWPPDLFYSGVCPHSRNNSCVEAARQGRYECPWGTGVNHSDFSQILDRSGTYSALYTPRNMPREMHLLHQKLEIAEQQGANVLHHSQETEKFVSDSLKDLRGSFAALDSKWLQYEGVRNQTDVLVSAASEAVAERIATVESLMLTNEFLERRLQEVVREWKDENDAAAIALGEWQRSIDAQLSPKGTQCSFLALSCHLSAGITSFMTTALDVLSSGVLVLLFGGILWLLVKCILRARIKCKAPTRPSKIAVEL